MTIECVVPLYCDVLLIYYYDYKLNGWAFAVPVKDEKKKRNNKYMVLEMSFPINEEYMFTCIRLLHVVTKAFK